MVNIKTKIQLKQLYETDENLWLEETIRLLRENCLEDLDLENLIEELESLGRRDKQRVESFLRQIIIHLLLLQYWTEEYDYNYRHWRGKIATFRVQLNKYLTTNLKNYLSEELESIYQDAVFIVIEKTGLNKSVLPEKCCYSLEELVDKNWLNH
ncbi:DUF29 domain-containing protein [Cyanothece sp. BG0011]|uniref:DUF29 domain-containing protein n=1 Tax=Cyanothece sp. BG0011 TaxID=2082950 RepID=UPI000D1ED5DF|nr:DUF29 domain-containing protein [Cyanothece sp. BG0011]